MMVAGRIRAWYNGSWLGEPVKTTRGTTIAAWTLITGTAFGAVWGTQTTLGEVAAAAEVRQYQLCVQRTEGRNDVRVAFNDLYDFVDPDHVDPEVNELRDRLNELLPPLSVDDCPVPD